MKYTTPVFLTSARRSAMGRFGGVFRDLPAKDLALAVASSVIPEDQRGEVDAVFCGQVLQAGSGMNMARQIGLGLGIPQSAQAMTVNMVCGSGLKAIALGADMLEQGDARYVLAGGVESMSSAPHLVQGARWGKKFGNLAMIDAILHDGLTDPFLHIHMGETAERVAEKFQISREDQDAYAERSHARATASREAFQREMVVIPVRGGVGEVDEQVRSDTSLEKLARLRPAFRTEGSVTAGNSSGINDGAAFVGLIRGDQIPSGAHSLRARVVASAACGCDPALMGLGPVEAIRKVCRFADWKLDEVDAVEINEAFAAQTLACQRELYLREDQLNRRGGAIALGHPIGCSGARILVTLLHILEDDGLTRGIASLCSGGGMGIAVAIERV